MSTRDTDYVPYSDVHQLRVLRRMLDIEQGECAGVINVTRSRYADLEIGNAPMTRQYFDAVYEHLHRKCRERYGPGGIPRTNVTRLNYLLYDNELTIMHLASMLDMKSWNLGFMRRGEMSLTDDIMQKIEQAVKNYKKGLMRLR